MEKTKPTPTEFGEINEAPIKDLVAEVYSLYTAGMLDVNVTKLSVMVAFKIEKDANSGRAVVSTKAVKMSFATERPFFPYREPEVKAHPAEDEARMEESRVLRVFFLGNNRMAGSLGAVPWNAETVWADAVDASLIDTMAKDLGIPHEEFPKGTWLTVFKDTASPRPGTAGSSRGGPTG